MGSPDQISGPNGCDGPQRTYIIGWAPGTPGATYYEVEEGDDRNGSYPLITTSATSIQLTHQSISGTTYNYRVRACNAGGCSPWRGTAYACVQPDGPPREPQTAPRTTWLHTDALGSPVAETDANGQVTRRQRYEPYGAPTDGSYIQGPGYTGHVTDAATGLSYMQQRYYDPVAGRFLSVDPVAADGNSGGNFNRYWYANNNPYRFTDPDGRSSCADPACKTSTVDSVVPRANSQPPGVNGTEGMSRSMAQKVDAGYATTVTFQNDNPNGASPNQPLATKTANAIESTISKSGVQSVNINSTTGGRHGPNSNHSRGRAVDINRVDGKKVNATNPGATQVQTAARQNSSIRENFGPTIMEKTITPGGAANAVTNQALVDDHADHIHLSGQQ